MGNFNLTHPNTATVNAVKFTAPLRSSLATYKSATLPVVDSIFEGIRLPESTDTQSFIQCSHISKSGRQCDREAVEDETLCVLHGGSVIRSKDRIARRLLALQEKSIATLEQVMIEGFDEKTRLAAACAVLDRTGHGPKSTLEVEERKRDLSKLSVSEIAAEIEQLNVLARQAAAQDSAKRTNEAPMTANASASKRTH